MTMIGESVVLNTEQSYGKKLSVVVMILGSIVAAANDLTFNAQGYVNVTVNNLFTAANNITVKKKLKAKELGKLGILFYNAMFSLIILVLYVYKKVLKSERCSNGREKAAASATSSHLMAASWSPHGYRVTYINATAVHGHVQDAIHGVPDIH